jgi:ubiquinone/menaquinone biosynthesis C-methylase UbiE
MKSKIGIDDRTSFEDFSKRVGFVNSVEDWARKHGLNTVVAVHEHLEIKDGIIREISKRKDLEIFDVGCGYGFFISRLTKLYSAKLVVGGDISKVQVYNARDRHVNGNLLVSCAEYFPFKDGSFQCVVCSEVIEHVVDPRISMLEMQRTLKNGGCLCITTDNPASVWRRVIKYIYIIAGRKKTEREEYLPLDLLLSQLPKNLKVYKVNYTCPYPLLPAIGPLGSATIGKFWLVLWQLAARLPFVGRQFYNKYAVFAIKQ